MNNDEVKKVCDILNIHFKKNVMLNKFNIYAPIEDVDGKLEVLKVPEGWIYEVYKIGKGIINNGNKFIVEYYDEEALEEIIGSLSDIHDKLFINEILKDYEEERNKLLNEYEYSKSKIKGLLTEIVKTCKERDKIFVQMNYDRNTIEIKNKIKNEIELIKKHKNFDGLYTKENILGICVKDLIIYEEISERWYWVGNAKIEIDLKYGCIKFYADENNKKGYWRDSQFHPHIDGCGDACYGDSDAAFATYLSEKEFYGLYLTAVNFLQSVNVHDVAGYAISYWDECDENGNIIREGHCPEDDEYGFSNPEDSKYYKRQYENGIIVTCKVCDCEINVEDAYMCDDCNENVCNDCINEITTPYGTRYVCDECLEQYVFCSDTDRYVLKEFAYWNEEYEEWFESEEGKE